MRSIRIVVAPPIVVPALAARCEAVQRNSGFDNHPKIERLSRQAYIAVRSQVSLAQLGKVIPASIGQVVGWLGAHGAHPTGPPFVRYLVVDMPKGLEIEIGFPVAGPIKAVAPFVAGALPAGRYLTGTYTGSNDGLTRAKEALGQRSWLDEVTQVPSDPPFNYAN